MRPGRRPSIGSAMRRKWKGDRRSAERKAGAVRVALQERGPRERGLGVRGTRGGAPRRARPRLQTPRRRRRWLPRWLLPKGLRGRRRGDLSFTALRHRERSASAVLEQAVGVAVTRAEEREAVVTTYEATVAAAAERRSGWCTPSSCWRERRQPSVRTRSLKCSAGRLRRAKKLQERLAGRRNM